MSNSTDIPITAGGQLTVMVEHIVRVAANLSRACISRTRQRATGRTAGILAGPGSSG